MEKRMKRGFANFRQFDGVQLMTDIPWKNSKETLAEVEMQRTNEVELELWSFAKF